MENLPPPIAGAPTLKPVMPPSGPPAGEEDKPAAAAGAPKSEVPPLVAVLDFVDPRSRPITLSEPFRWDGRLIVEITVRKLLTMEVASLIGRDGALPDIYEAYALMTGLPAAVLRGLDADDGEKLTGAAFDFLPQLLRRAYGSA